MQCRSGRQDGPKVLFDDFPGVLVARQRHRGALESRPRSPRHRREFVDDGVVGDIGLVAAVDRRHGLQRGEVAAPLGGHRTGVGQIGFVEILDIRDLVPEQERRLSFLQHDDGFSFVAKSARRIVLKTFVRAPEYLSMESGPR
jgi:hypothetical protein